MSESSTSRQVYHFGEFQLDERILRHRGERIPLQPKVLDTLVALVAEAGAVVDKEALIERVWPDTFVTESGLQRNISVLRKTLEEHGGGGPYIETIARRGYRFLPAVTVAEEGTAPHAQTIERESLPDRPSGGTRRLLAGAAAVGLAIAAFAYFAYREPDETFSGPFEVTPLTSDPGSESSPSLSPDGKRIAYSWAPQGELQGDIYAKGLDDAEPIQLTADPAEESSPTWSPDGSRVAFLREIGDESSVVGVVRAGGGPTNLLAHVRTWADSGIAWTPDGESLAVFERETEAPDAGVQLVYVAADSGEKHPQPLELEGLGEAFAAAFSPEGERLAFLGSSGAFPVSVYVWRRGERTPEQIGSLDGRGDGLAWTGDGRQLIVGRRTPIRTRTLWRADVARKRITEVQLGDNPSQPSIAQGSSLLAFTERLAQYEVWRYSVSGDGDEPGESWLASTRFDGNPQYSPDGERIVFTSARGGELEVWICEADGSNPVKLTSVGTVGSPRWSPDGTQIAFDALVDGSADIYMASVKGGLAFRVAASEWEEAVPAWAPDTRWIYFTSNRGGTRQIWRALADDGEHAEAEQVTTDGGFYPVIPKGGEYLYYAKERALVCSLWRMRLPAGEPELILPVVSSGWGNWQVLGSRLYFLDAEPEGEIPDADRDWMLRYLDLESREVVTVRSLASTAAMRRPTLNGPGFSISPDGAWVLVGQQGFSADLMLVRDFR